MTSLTKVQSASARLFAGTWRPLVSVIATFYDVAIIFQTEIIPKQFQNNFMSHLTMA